MFLSWNSPKLEFVCISLRIEVKTPPPPKPHIRVRVQTYTYKSFVFFKNSNLGMSLRKETKMVNANAIKIHQQQCLYHINSLVYIYIL